MMRTRGSLLPLMMLFMLAPFVGCKDGVTGSEGAQIQITPRTFRFTAGTSNDSQRVYVKNIGEGALRLTDFEPNFGPEFSLDWIPPTDSDSGVAAQRIGVEGGVNSLPNFIEIPPDETLTFVMLYTPTANGPSAGGDFRFRTNAQNESEDGFDFENVKLDIELPSGTVEIGVNPIEVNINHVRVRSETESVVTVTSIGQLPVEIYSLQLSGAVADPADEEPNGFWLTVNGENPITETRVLVDPDGDGVPGLQGSFEIVVHHQTLVEGVDEGVLSIHSNDPSKSEFRVNLRASSVSPCVSIAPEAIEFPASLINRTAEQTISIQSCGGEALEVFDIELAGDTAAAFMLDEESLPELPYTLPGYDSSQDTSLPSRDIKLQFHPTEQAPYTGTLLVRTNDPSLYADAGAESGLLEVPITGLGTINECPTACVAQQEFNVAPLEILTLDGSCSTDFDGPGGKPTKYRWSVVQAPPGSTAQPVENFFNLQRPADGGLNDDDETPSAFFFVDLAGEYVLELTVEDNQGMVAPSEGCSQPAAVVHISARPDSDIHVELTWDTPGDPDQTDMVEGTDVDLHLLHPNGTSWHNGPLDCFYANQNPDWGIAGPANNCTLDIDDTNGAGPENINVREPEDTNSLGAPYRIGVHYYSATLRIGMPELESTATVRVYLGGVLAVEWSRVISHRNDFWEVGAVIWGAGEQRVQEINRFTSGI